MSAKEEAGVRSELQDETDEILFLHLACRSIDPGMADRASRVLWSRHRDCLRESCFRLCRQFKVGTEKADDLMAVTWTKVNDNAERYRTPEGLAFDGQVRRTRAWMNKIAENQLIDWTRNPHLAYRVGGEELDRSVENYSGEDIAAYLATELDAKDSAYRLTLAAQAFEELNETEQLVLRATVAYRSYSPKGSYMERGSATALAERLNTTPPALRKRRQRAIEKIVRFIKANDRTGRKP